MEATYYAEPAIVATAAAAIAAIDTIAVEDTAVVDAPEAVGGKVDGDGVGAAVSPASAKSLLLLLSSSSSTTAVGDMVKLARSSTVGEGVLLSSCSVLATSLFLPLASARRASLSVE